MEALETQKLFIFGVKWVCLFLFSLCTEKGISILQNRRFNRRYAFALFLLVFGGGPLIKEIFSIPAIP